jgi:hypothetical protein
LAPHLITIGLGQLSLQTKGGITMAPDPLHTHGQVIRVVASPAMSVMTAHASGPRSEALCNVPLAPETPYTIRFKFLNASTHYDTTTFFQIVDNTIGILTEPRLKMALTNKGYALTVGTSATQPDSVAGKSFVMAPCAPDVGKWTQWSIEIKRSATHGYLRITKDGKLIANLSGIATTYAPRLLQNPDSHLKFGVYRHSVTETQTEYYTDFTIQAM